MVGDGFEPPNPKERIYSPPRLATSLPLRHEECRQEDFNPQPTDYKSVALPIELHRQITISRWLLYYSNLFLGIIQSEIYGNTNFIFT